MFMEFILTSHIMNDVQQLQYTVVVVDVSSNSTCIVPGYLVGSQGTWRIPGYMFKRTMIRCTCCCCLMRVRWGSACRACRGPPRGPRWWCRASARPAGRSVAWRRTRRTAGSTAGRKRKIWFQMNRNEIPAVGLLLVSRADRKSQVRQCLGFCTADFLSSLANESAEQKP